MVHRTDIAGGSADRQVLAVSACVVADLNGTLLENDASPKTLPFQDSSFPRLFLLPTRSAAASRRQFYPTMPTISNS